MARELTPEELVKAPMYINRDVQFEMPRRSTRVDKKYKCTCCGKSWDNQRSHFAKSPSPYTRVMMDISTSVMIVWTYIYRN